VARKPRPARSGPPDAIDLALQGGGSHGAFTWGVLDRLLEDESLAFSGVSGTSAGALNAAVLATGWADGGRDGARAALQAFWLDVAREGRCFGGTGVQAGASLASFDNGWNPGLAWMNLFLRSFSPYQFNPLDINPLRDAVRRHVKVQHLQNGPLQLFVAATAVRSGQQRVFSGTELSVDVLLASACLPQLFRAVQIGDQPYWDGGYSGNPALWPLIYNTEPLDIVLVRINPSLRPGTPETAAEIADRVNEIGFNAGLLGELRAIAFVQKLLAEGRVDPGVYKDLRLHMVADDDSLAPLHPSSKLNTDQRFLESLRDLGRVAAASWLRRHRADIGVRATLDIRKTFLGER
jgi:NTE family protein